MTSTNPPFSSDALAVVLFQTLQLAPNTALAVGYSGGLDSHVLLHALASLRRHGLRLRALHIHHGLHPDATHWEAHCRAVCAALEIPFVAQRVQVAQADDLGLEGAAREARYRALAAALVPGERLCTAHHRDDQAETFMLRLLRGAGVHGLGAMAPVSPFAASTLVRPLLSFSRAALRDYAEHAGLQWIEDPSNDDTRHARNFMRAEVLPLLQRRWPAASAVISRATTQMRAAAALVDELAQADYTAVAGAGQALSVSRLLALSPLRRENLIRYWLVRRGFHPPSVVHLTETLRLVTGGPQGCVAWPGVEVRRYRDDLYALTPLAPVPTRFAAAWDFPRPLTLAPLGLRLEAQAGHGDGIAATAFTGAANITVRLRQGGERCRIAQRGHSFSVKKLLQESAIPPWERGRLPLIYIDDTLAAVGGAWICAPFAAVADEPSYKIVQTPLG